MAEERPSGALDAKDLLLADLQHFENAMARNEETGEKRFSFLISLLTAVCGGLAALYTSKDVDPGRVSEVATGASLALGGFAILTFLRLVHRNRVTDEHKATLRYIRKTYRRLCPDLDAHKYSVPAAASGSRRVLRGGYAEMTGVVTAVLLAAGHRLWMRQEELPAPAVKQAGWLPTVAIAVVVAMTLVLLAALMRDPAPKATIRRKWRRCRAWGRLLAQRRKRRRRQRQGQR